MHLKETQVNEYGLVLMGKYWKIPEDGSSILVGNFSDFFWWLPAISWWKEQEVRWKAPGKNLKIFRPECCFNFPGCSGAFLPKMTFFPVDSCRTFADPGTGIFEPGKTRNLSRLIGSDDFRLSHPIARIRSQKLSELNKWWWFAHSNLIRSDAVNLTWERFSNH